jgi:hypothetical protein
MSWGQHFFHWNTPEYWAEVNRQEETNLHNTWAIFEKTPRSILETGIFIGGLMVPFAAMFYPWLRACRASLFLPADALVPTALGAFIFKLLDRLQQSGYVDTILKRPSETIETYLYFFILAYLIVYARRIKALEVAEGRATEIASCPKARLRGASAPVRAWRQWLRPPLCAHAAPRPRARARGSRISRWRAWHRAA